MQSSLPRHSRVQVQACPCCSAPPPEASQSGCACLLEGLPAASAAGGALPGSRLEALPVMLTRRPAGACRRRSSGPWPRRSRRTLAQPQLRSSLARSRAHRRPLLKLLAANSKEPAVKGGPGPGRAQPREGGVRSVLAHGCTRHLPARLKSQVSILADVPRHHQGCEGPAEAGSVSHGRVWHSRCHATADCHCPGVASTVCIQQPQRLRHLCPGRPLGWLTGCGGPASARSRAQLLTDTRLGCAASTARRPTRRQTPRSCCRPSPSCQRAGLCGRQPARLPGVPAQPDRRAARGPGAAPPVRLARDSQHCRRVSKPYRLAAAACWHLVCNAACTGRAVFGTAAAHGHASPVSGGLHHGCCPAPQGLRSTGQAATCVTNSWPPQARAPAIRWCAGHATSGSFQARRQCARHARPGCS